jgi:hypothetical protein
MKNPLITNNKPIKNMIKRRKKSENPCTKKKTPKRTIGIPKRKAKNEISLFENIISLHQNY